MLEIKEISQVANDIVATAKGDTHKAVGDFGTCATTALEMGTNQILPAISQVLEKTIFSYRPYTAKFKGLFKDDITYGNHRRKLTPLDTDFEKDQQLYKADGSILADGDSVDMYKIAKPRVLQTNFYGFDSYQKHLTIFKNQIDTAFNSEGELQSFLSMVMGGASDQLEQAREELARGLVVQAILGTGTRIHLLTEYNNATGLSLTPETVMQPLNYKPFMQWVYARLETLSDTLEARTTLFHTNPTIDGEVQKIVRHTPKEKQHLYMLSEFINKSANLMEANTFNTEYLSKMNAEKVLYWQNPTEKAKILAGTTYHCMAQDGNIETKTLDKDDSTVVGILFDDEAIGINKHDQWSGTTPLNVASGYHNIYWHEGARFWVDNTENAVVLCLD